MATTLNPKSIRNGLVINTLAMAQRLQAVGVPEKQAHEQVEIIAEVFEHNMSTKQDIEVLRKDMELMKTELKTELRKDIEVLRKEMYEMKSNLIFWVAGMLFAQAGFIITLQKLL